MAIAVVLSLVGGGAVAVVTGRVVVASPVTVDTGTTLSETASAPFDFVNRSYEMLPLNTSISVNFFDSDQYTPHTFTILNRSDYEIPNPATFSNGQLGQLLQTYGTLVNVSANPGEHGPAAAISEVADPGWYEFVCIESGHFQSGMYGFIAFGELLPTNLTFGGGSPGPGLAVFIIVGTIVTLTVLAIVLGFVVGRRRGAEHEMPPERLGYPEPPAGDAAPPPPPPPLRPS